MKPFRIHVDCLPGLLPFLREEAEEYGFFPVETRRTGLVLLGHRNLLYRALALFGTASGLRLEVAAFPARSLGELERKTAALDWNRHFHPGSAWRVRAISSKSRLGHTGAVEERVARGVAASIGGAIPPKEDEPGIPVPVLKVRILNDRCRIDLDPLGTPLPARSWRTETGPASLRPDLALALVRASGWDRRSPLFDPMAGCGTIPIEAGGLALRLPAGRGPREALRAFVWHDEDERLRIETELLALAERPSPPLRILAADKDPVMCARARRNAERAGILDLYDGEAAALSRQTFWRGPHGPKGAVVTDPPFGKRSGDPERLPRLLRALGARLTALPPDWRIAILGPDPRKIRKLAVPLVYAFSSLHGGIDVQALVRPPHTRISKAGSGNRVAGTFCDKVRRRPSTGRRGRDRRDL